jgi:hypothetical protein
MRTGSLFLLAVLTSILFFSNNFTASMSLLRS